MDNVMSNSVWVGTWAATGLAVVIATLGASSTLRRWNLICLLLLGTVSFSFTAIGFGWAILNYRDAPSMMIFGGICLIMGALGYCSWPNKRLVSLRDMATEELKRSQRNFANSLRDFENEFDRGIQASRDRASYEQMAGAMESKFRKVYLSDALAMRCELLRRAAEPCPPVTEANVGLYDLPIALTGLLAGASPISQIANYLDQLGNRL